MYTFQPVSIQGHKAQTVFDRKHHFWNRIPLIRMCCAKP